MITMTKTADGSLSSGFYWLSQDIVGTAEPVLLPAGGLAVSVAIHPAAGQIARVEFTLSSPDAVAAGTAKWIPWDLANVSSPSADGIMTLASAIRGVSSGGTATLEVVAR